MRKCYATALVLFSWFLMLPPPVYPPVKNPQGDFVMNTSAPLSKWLTLKTYKSEEACKERLKSMEPFYKCIASYDTALKPRPAAAPNAPAAPSSAPAAPSAPGTAHTP